MRYPKGLLDERLVTLGRAIDSQQILLAMSIQTSLADILRSGFASIYGSESLNPFRIVAFYFDVILFSLGKVSTSILENVISRL